LYARALSVKNELPTRSESAKKKAVRKLRNIDYLFSRLESGSPSGLESSATFLAQEDNLSSVDEGGKGGEDDNSMQQVEENREGTNEMTKEGQAELAREAGVEEEEGYSFSSGESSHSTVSGSSIMNWNYSDFRQVFPLTEGNTR
jgi:hypothetical protein